MKIFCLVLTSLLLISTTGCVKTNIPGVFERTGVFANLEFDEADYTVTTYYTNGVSYMKVETITVRGLKSDTQKALETANKALEALQAAVK